MVNSPHDALFWYTFGQVEHAVPLLRTALPRAAAGGLDWSTLTLLESKQVGAGLRRRQTDLLFSARTRHRQREVLVHVLVEHSSRVWRWMALRMLAYSVGIWRRWLRHRPRRRSLPRIIPVIVHHGRRDWWAKTEFRELLDSGESEDEVEWFQPQFRYVVLSTAPMAPSEIDSLELSTLGKVTLASLQFVPGSTLDKLTAVYRRWACEIRHVLLTPSGEEAMVALSEYVLTTTRVAQDALSEMVENEVNQRASKIMETTATRLRREGREEGRLEGRTRLLRSLIKARFGRLSAEIGVRLAEASPETAERWALRLLEAESLEDVFADE